MKKFNMMKTIQLILFIIVSVICLIVIFTDDALYHQIAADPHIRLLCIMLWVALVLSFLSILLDFSLFSSFKRDYSELDYAVHSDPVSGISNRYSCDVYIEKYMDKPLPQEMGCIMLELTNIKETNDLYGHGVGNALIRDFSNILKITAVNLCFVGRNGGNKFLAIFETADEEKLHTFLTRVGQKVKVHNNDPENNSIEYKFGTALQEHDEAKTITELIALSNKRISL